MPHMKTKARKAHIAKLPGSKEQIWIYATDTRQARKLLEKSLRDAEYPASIAAQQAKKAKITS
jgi:hypothetical protein